MDYRITRMQEDGSYYRAIGIDYICRREGMDYRITRMQGDGSYRARSILDSFVSTNYTTILRALRYSFGALTKAGDIVRVVEFYTGEFEDPDTNYKYYIYNERGKWVQITKDEAEVIGMLRKK